MEGVDHCENYVGEVMAIWHNRVIAIAASEYLLNPILRRLLICSAYSATNI